MQEVKLINPHFHSAYLLTVNQFILDSHQVLVDLENDDH